MTEQVSFKTYTRRVLNELEALVSLSKGNPTYDFLYSNYPFKPRQQDNFLKLLRKEKVLSEINPIYSRSPFDQLTNSMMGNYSRPVIGYVFTINKARLGIFLNDFELSDEVISGVDELPRISDDKKYLVIGDEQIDLASANSPVETSNIKKLALLLFENDDYYASKVDLWNIVHDDDAVSVSTYDDLTPEQNKKLNGIIGTLNSKIKEKTGHKKYVYSKGNDIRVDA